MTSRILSVVSVLLLVSALSLCLAEVDWLTAKDTMEPRIARLVYDPGSESVIFRSGTYSYPIETYLLSQKNTWTLKSLEYEGEIYDSHPFYSVNLGRVLCVVEAEPKIWSWNGSSWEIFIEYSDAEPTNRSLFSTAYDTNRNVLVLFGGAGPGSAMYNETWEWDGLEWSKKTPLHKPMPQSQRQMVYFEKEAVCVLFGMDEVSDDSSFHECFLCYWDGIDWEHVIPSGGILGERNYFAASYDPVREVLVTYGGSGYRYPENQTQESLGTWEFDGNVWTEIATETVPKTGYGDMAYDPSRDRMVLFGGYEDGILRNRTYLYDGTDWEEIAFSQHFPYLIYGFSMAYNSNTNKSLLCTDGVGETWEWDGINWSRLYPTGVSPSTRYAGMAYDSHRDNFILFGGDINGEYRGSTWIFNGTQWVEKNLTSKPSKRGHIQLVYDSHRDRVVLFGGEIGHFEYTDFYSDETWEWDGVTWLKREPALHPPAISMYSMAYDSHRHCTVLYGGITQTGFDPYHPVYEENHDIWEWDGTTWVRKRRAFNPGYSYSARMAYDSNRRRCVLYEYIQELTWEWDGADWHRMEPLSNDPGDDGTYQIAYGLVYDSLRKTTWMQCSRTWDTGLYKTWAYGHTNPDICPGLGVTLSLPSSWFIPDETFSLTASVCNNTGETLTGYPLFVVLDVFGEYFWGPGWTTTFDNYLDELPVWEEGATDLVIIPEFAWPDGAGTASGIRFIACMTDPAITIPYGEIAVAEFGWGE